MRRRSFGHAPLRRLPHQPGEGPQVVGVHVGHGPVGQSALRPVQQRVAALRRFLYRQVAALAARP